MNISVRVDGQDGGWLATVSVEQEGRRTTHRVTVLASDLDRYGATNAAALVDRSFEFLLARKPNTSILREFRITEIERYFPGFREWIRSLH